MAKNYYQEAEVKIEDHRIEFYEQENLKNYIRSMKLTSYAYKNEAKKISEDKNISVIHLSDTKMNNSGYENKNARMVVLNEKQEKEYLNHMVGIF